MYIYIYVYIYICAILHHRPYTIDLTGQPSSWLIKPTACPHPTPRTLPDPSLRAPHHMRGASSPMGPPMWPRVPTPARSRRHAAMRARSVAHAVTRGLQFRLSPPREGTCSASAHALLLYATRCMWLYVAHSFLFAFACKYIKGKLIHVLLFFIFIYMHVY